MNYEGRSKSNLVSRNRLMALIIILVTTVVTVLIFRGTDPTNSDATGDWVAVNAAARGMDLFLDIDVLAAASGAEYHNFVAEATDAPLLAFRTPGAFLLLFPLLLVSVEQAHLLVVLVGVLSFLGLVLCVIPGLCRVQISEIFVPLCVLPVSLAFVESIHWGTVSSVVALLVALTWRFSQSEARSGIWLGLATTLKLYPGMGLVPMAADRPSRKSLMAAAASIVLVNGLGVLLTGLSISDAARLILQGSAPWMEIRGNISLPGVLARAGLPGFVGVAVVLLSVVGVWLFSRRRPFDQSMALALAVAVVVSPLAWLHYDVMVLPVVMMLFTRRSVWRPAGILSAAWIALNTGSFVAATFGDISAVLPVLFVARLALVAAVALSPEAVWAPRRSVVRVT